MGVRVVDGLRSSAVGFVASTVVMIGCALAASPALAAGDANRDGCPVSTESSPGFRISLPDCRAYEIVSEANGGDATNVTGSFGFPEGEHVYYKSFLPTPGGARDGLPERFLATREVTGWVQRAISPPQGEGPSHLSLGAESNAEGVSFTADFSEAFVNSMFRDPFEEPQLNETTGMGVYRMSMGSGGVSLLSLPDSGALTQEMIETPDTPEYAGLAAVNGWGAFLAGGSTDGSRAFFVTTAKLATAPGTPQDTHEAGNEIYERTGGHTYLVGILPNGSVANCGAEVGQGVPSTLGVADYSYGAVAPSGVNVVFSASNCREGGLFLRDVVSGTTVQLPGGAFAGRAGTGAGEEEVILTLGAKLYEYHVDTRETTEVGEGDLLAYSADGSRVYSLGGEGIFVYHNGVTERVPGTEAGGYLGGGTAGGVIRAPGEYAATANMPVASGGASDGSHLLFIDSAQLTGYENDGHFEAYVFDAESGRVTCVSCNPSGAPPSTPPRAEEGTLASEVGRAQLIDEFSLDNGEQQYQTPSPPFISDDGSRAVFETNEALVPQDVNGAMDVYEWEREGSNGCEAPSAGKAASATYSPVTEGCVYLLSSGLGKEVPNNNGIADGTHLEGASENLNDVYIQTSESLLPGLDNASKLYDVRVDGGFPYTVPTVGCEAEQCTAAGGEAATPVAAGTESVAGSGEVTRRVRAHEKQVVSARRRRLKHALRLCRRRKNSRRRQACERAARRRYGAKASQRAHVAGEGSVR